MKENINKILDIWKEVKLLKDNKLEKENNILSCINLIEKSVNAEDAENIQLKQKGIASSLIDTNNELYSKIDSLGEIFKGLDINSLKSGKLSIELLKNFMYSGISVNSVREIKEILKSFNEEKYSDIPMNKELNRVGLTYSSYLINV